MNKTPKPLNPEALALVKATIPRLNEAEMDVVRSLISYNIKIEETKAQAKLDVINRMKKADEECQKFITAGDEKIDHFHTIRREFISNLREIQPELHTIEFELRPEDGTYVPVGARKTNREEVENNDEACGLPPMPDNIPEDVKQTVELLLQKITGKPN